MRFHLLGALEVYDGERALPVGGPRQRAVLALLLLRANKLVAVDELAEAVWERPPASARSNLRTYVAGLRRVLGEAEGSASRLVSGPQGYRLEVQRGELDLWDFEELTTRAALARQHRQLTEACRLYQQALALWQCRSLTSLSPGAVLRTEAAKLEERRQDVSEQAIECRLELGQHRELAAEIREQIALHPYREELRCLLMLALHRSGRRAEALTAYRDARRLLVAELGVEPGVRLRQVHAEILAADPAGASLTTGVARPFQLPNSVSAFTGRGNELARLDRLRGQAGNAAAVVTISGTAGIGKTALAVHWAHLVAADYPDGQIFLDLQGFGRADSLDESDALDRLLRGLGSAPIPAALPDRIATYRSATAGRRLLIVLDNARSSTQVRPLLLSHPGCLALITSRDRLAGLAAFDGARPVVLDMFSKAEGLGLLADILDDGRADQEFAAAEALVDLCAGLPLALRLVATRLATAPRQTISAETASLGSRSRLLDLRTTDDGSTIRTAFDSSYLALAEGIRRSFRLASRLPGPDFTPLAVAALLDCSEAAAEASLEALISASLVDRSAPGRCRMHDVVRQYAVDRSAADDAPAEQRAASERALSWYLHSADAASRLIDPDRHRSFSLDQPKPGLSLPQCSDRDAALAWFEVERPALVSAVRAAADQGFHDLGWQLPVVMGGFFELRKYWADWITTHKTGLTSARMAGNRPVESCLHNGLGIAYQRMGEVDVAIGHYRKALRIRQEIGERQGDAATRLARPAPVGTSAGVIR